MTGHPSSGAALHSFAGNPAPPALVDAWRRFRGLDSEARSALWAIVVPLILEPADPEHRRRLEAFCRDHQVAEDVAVAVVQACGQLLRQAGALDLDQEHFRQDLATLSNGTTVDAGVLLDRYDELKGRLRRQIVAETLAQHGKVLVGLDWRVDQVVGSDRGTRLNTSVVFLTLRYRDGDRLDRITLQLTPEALTELKQFSERIGG